MYEVLRKGATVNELFELTKIKHYFIEQMKELVEEEEKIASYKGNLLPDYVLKQAKKDGFADKYISKLLDVEEKEIKLSAEKSSAAEVKSELATQLKADDSIKDAAVGADGKISITAAEGYKVEIVGGVGAFDGKISGETAKEPKAGEINESRKKLAAQFDSILGQIDKVANDASYKGVNLLQGNDLKVVFNEDRTSDLIVEGKDASSAGLKISKSANDWKTDYDVEASIKQVEDAVNTLRTMSSEFGNNYSIVQSRETFTENLINVLEEGSDKLTLADMNEESANMLALQTRQQLAINSLSLASQAAQSVLKLF